MDKLLSTLNDYLKAASDIVGHYAPSMWDATLKLVFWTSLVHLVFLGVSTLVIVVLWRFWKKIFLSLEKLDCDSILAILCTVGLIILSIFTIVGWANSTYDLLGIVDPRLAILYKLAIKAGLL